MSEVTMANARARFGALVDEARRHAPVIVTRHGRPAVAVVDYDTWKRLSDIAEDLDAVAAYDAAKAEPGDYATLADVRTELGL